MTRHIVTAFLFLTVLCGCQRSGGVDGQTVLTAFQQEADLAVTELTVRKIAYYDSSVTDHVVLTDPSTWRVGDRRCIVPVEVRIRYGYDLRQLTLESIRIDDEHKAVIVHLPEPKIIDSGYDRDVNYDEVVSIATGLRDPIGHETIETIRHEAYQAVMQQDFEELVGKEIRYNTELLLTGMVRSMGFEQLIIE